MTFFGGHGGLPYWILDSIFWILNYVFLLYALCSMLYALLDSGYSLLRFNLVPCAVRLVAIAPRVN